MNINKNLRSFITVKAHCSITHLNSKNHVDSSPPLGLGCNRSHILHPWPSGVLEETKRFLFFMLYWTMGLNSDKTSKVFCINICSFSTRFYLFVPRWHKLTQVSSKLCMCSISAPHKIRTLSRSLWCYLQRSLPRKRFWGRGIDACDAQIRNRFTPSISRRNNCCMFNAWLLGNGRYMATGSQRDRGRGGAKWLPQFCLPGTLKA